MEAPEVWVWPGDYGLPSAHPPCLRLLTQLKLIGHPVKILQKTNAYVTPNGTFPLFRYKNIQLNDYDKINNFLLEKGKDVDSHLSVKEKADAYIYEKYINYNLNYCLQYAWWVDQKNFEESMRPWFAKCITIPFNFYYPGQFKKNASDLIDVIYGDFLEPDDIYYSIYENVDACFENLSLKLGKSNFFLGETPCSVDASAFAFLAPILKFPLKNPVIINHLNKYDNLVKYVHRIQKTYFGDFEDAYIASHKDKTPSNKEEVNGKNDNVQNTIFAIIFASIAMLGFAHTNGLLWINLNDANSDYNDMFDGDDDDN